MLLEKKVVLIGIAGGSASGKTSIAHRIYESFRDCKSIVILKEDDYYKDEKHLSLEERKKINYDHPLSFDHNLLVDHLYSLKNRQGIHKPIYDHSAYLRRPEKEFIEAADVVILEGLFVLENKEIRSLLDMKIFVDTPPDIRFIRRLQRDLIERGRTIDSVISQYTETVRAMHDEFIEPSKKFADIIIPEGGKNSVAVDLLETKISSILKRNSVTIMQR